MDRREFFQTSIIAHAGGRMLSDVDARSRPGACRRPRRRPASGAPPHRAPPPRRLIMDAYTRNLHWLRTADEIAEAAIEMTCGGVNPTIQAYPGHIDPTKVATGAAGVREDDAEARPAREAGPRRQPDRPSNAPNLEAMVGTMGQLGVTHYWIGTDNYDLTKPIMPQLDAIKLKVEQFVKLNQKHGTTLMYHTRAGASSVGSVVWDLLYVMKDFDPKHVGLPLGYRAHVASRQQHVGAADAHGRAVRRRRWAGRIAPGSRTSGFSVRADRIPGRRRAAAAAATGGRARRRRGRGGAAARGRGAGGRQQPGAGRPRWSAVVAARCGGAAIRRRTAGEGGPPAGGRGRGRSGAAAAAAEFPLPLAGNTFARGGGWSSPYVPMGTGLVDIFRYARGACATSGSTGRWSWRPSIRTAARRAAPTS